MPAWRIVIDPVDDEWHGETPISLNIHELQILDNPIIGGPKARAQGRRNLRNPEYPCSEASFYQHAVVVTVDAKRHGGNFKMLPLYSYLIAPRRHLHIIVNPVDDGGHGEEHGRLPGARDLGRVGGQPALPPEQPRADEELQHLRQEGRRPEVVAVAAVCGLGGRGQQPLRAGA